MTRRAGVVAAVLAAALVVALALGGCTGSSGPRSPTPGSPAPRLAVSGDLAAHDPQLVAGQDGGAWHVYSTGDQSIGDGNIEIRTSPDGHKWTLAGTVWKKKPAWLSSAVPGVTNLWAPMLYHHGSTWYLYYAASTFGSNQSVIALATNTTLDARSPSYRWVDRGEVIGSQKTDDFNAIDPTVIDDSHGTPWMAFGSFWSGIRMVKLSWPTGKRADAATPLKIADRGTPPNAIEAATILRHGGWYYLIVSRDFCCQGSASTYNMAYGRSRSVTGPYLDKKGDSMLFDGGSALLATRGSQAGPGGESYSHGYLAWHFYNVDVGGATTLAIQKLRWTTAGWPTLASR
jgi:arabinan endo-1,5-alpha-L-arabinosidase